MPAIANDAGDVPPPDTNVYRVNVKDVTSGEIQVKTVEGKNPDDVVGRVLDQVGMGLMDAEAFWDRYTITAIIQELAAAN